MGAVSGQTGIIVTQGQSNVYKAMRQAYVEACDDAAYMYGHDAYNGEINNTHLPKLITPKYRYGSKAFERWFDELVEDLDKRDCVAIEVPRTHILKHNPRLKGKRNIKGFVFGYCAPN